MNRNVDFGLYLGGMAFLSFLQVICGVGSPVATQTKAAIPPAFTLWLMGASLITGGSAKKNRQMLNLITSSASPLGTLPLVGKLAVIALLSLFRPEMDRMLNPSGQF